MEQLWWKTVPYSMFKQNFERSLERIYKSFKKYRKRTNTQNFEGIDFDFIPPKLLLLKCLRSYPPVNWRRDMVSKLVIDGEKKLYLIEEFLCLQELALSNNLINLRENEKYKVNALAGILTKYFGTWNAATNPDIEVQNDKQRKIELIIGKETGKLELFNK